MEAKSKKMGRKETPAPYCHGEPMEPTYRFLAADEVIYRTWVCTHFKCGNKTELPLYVEEED